jgi:hypothetical protein
MDKRTMSTVRIGSGWLLGGVSVLATAGLVFWIANAQ